MIHRHIFRFYTQRQFKKKTHSKIKFFKGFSLRLIRKFAIQILKTLDILKKKEIIHCDLKPENILLKEKGKSGIKISDFSSACYDQYQMYFYIQSRSYRAPEVLFGAKYTYPIDMWSLGCILAELYTGNTLFGGADEDDQVACIIEVIGMPPEKFLKVSDKRYNFVSSRGFPRYCTITQPDGEVAYTDGKNSEGVVRGRPGTRKLTAALNDCPDRSFVNLIRACLEWDPSKRITPSQALRHEFIAQEEVINNPRHQQFLAHSRSATLTSSRGQPSASVYQSSRIKPSQTSSVLTSSRPRDSSKTRESSSSRLPSSSRTTKKSSSSSNQQLQPKTKSFVR